MDRHHQSVTTSEDVKHHSIVGDYARFGVNCPDISGTLPGLLGRISDSFLQLVAIEAARLGRGVIPAPGFAGSMPRIME